MVVYLNLNYSATKQAFTFQRKVDAYGKLYGYLPSIAKWLPKLSDFQPARESSVALYDIFKVIIFQLSFIANRFNILIIFCGKFDIS